MWLVLDGCGLTWLLKFSLTQMGVLGGPVELRSLSVAPHLWPASWLPAAVKKKLWVQVS